MFRVRFHGRGGQGVKTASRILGTAFFREGFEVQDAPRYGAERRGAPIFAYVRADRAAIDQRGVIDAPDLVIVVDDSLVPLPASAVTSGLRDHTTLLIHSSSSASEWADRLQLSEDRVVIVPAALEGTGVVKTSAGVRCAGAGARLFGATTRQSVEDAVRIELAKLPASVIDHNVELAVNAFDEAAPYEGVAVASDENDVDDLAPPDWVDLPLDPARIASPTIHGLATSLASPTGFWRTLRPVLDASVCKQCYWLCTTFCPDNVMVPADDGTPVIDYAHCKGCMLCLAQCPHHAIRSIPEAAWRAAQAEAGGGA